MKRFLHVSKCLQPEIKLKKEEKTESRWIMEKLEQQTMLIGQRNINIGIDWIKFKKNLKMKQITIMSS